MSIARSTTLLSCGPPDWGPILLRQFRENPFELAGLADLPDEPATLAQVASAVAAWVATDSEATPSSERLAELMFILLRVAQDGYQDGTYWPHIERRLGLSIGQARQRRLGEGFLSGLRRFGYFVPVLKKALAYVSPILIHAGIPRASVPSFLAFVRAQVERHGAWLADPDELDPELLGQLAADYPGPIHTNVRRLMQSHRRGVAELWAAPAQAILARGDEEALAEALRQLPPSIDPDTMRAALAGGEAPRSVDAPFLPPRLKYDPQSGAVRLWLPEGGPGDWIIRPTSLRLGWDRVPSGAVAELFDPPLEAIEVRPARAEGHLSRTFVTRSARWPGHWFRARTGQMEQGTVLDRSGLDPGRWFVLFEGRPDDPGDAEPRPLNWAFFGHREWTAWEVEILPRAPGRESFRWRVGPNEFSVPLARRPGPALDAPEPSAMASADELDRIPVYAEAPSVILRRDRAVRALLERRVGRRFLAVAPLDLEPDRPCRPPADSAGLYRIRESGGVGRLLLEFATIPGLRVDGPSPRGEAEVVVILKADPDAGWPVDPGPSGPQGARLERLGTRAWAVSRSTVEPALALTWHWRDGDAPPLTFRWAVHGVRWRVTGLAKPPRWTRDMLVLDDAEAIRADALIEVQVPPAADLAINGAAAVLEEGGAAGPRAIRRLAAYRDDVVRLRSGGWTFEAALITRRPVLDQFVADLDDDKVVACWEGARPPDGTVLLAWDPTRPGDRPTAIRLTARHLDEERGWTGSWSELPDAQVVVMALARAHSAAGFGLRAHYILAVSSLELDQPCCAVVRRGGRGTPAEDGWPGLAMEIQKDLLSNAPRGRVNVAGRLASLRARGPLDFGEVLAFAASLEDAPLLGASDRLWRRLYADEIRKCLADPPCLPAAMHYAITAGGEGIGRLLRAGIHPGWGEPAHLLAIDDLRLESVALPLGYVRDLWLISQTPEVVSNGARRAGIAAGEIAGWERCLARQKDAARRVAAFHTAWGLAWPACVLPLRRSVMRVCDEPRSHRHTLDLARTEPEQSVDAFLEELGLDALVLDGRRSPGGEPLKLMWVPGPKPAWAAQWYWGGRYRKCCDPGSTPGLVPPWEGDRLANVLKIRRSLLAWISEGLPPRGLPGYEDDAALDDLLRLDPTTKSFAVAVLDHPPPGTKVLFGREVPDPDRFLLPDAARLAWRIAWIDRLAAGRGPEAMFAPSGTLPMTRRQHLEALASALEAARPLMVRCLALAELARRTLCDGGLGVAAKFDRG